MSAIFPMIAGINFEEFGSSAGVLAVQIEFVVFFWWVEGGNFNKPINTIMVLCNCLGENAMLKYVNAKWLPSLKHGHVSG